jgi:hypothetical protein
MSRLLDTIDSDGERVAASSTLTPELIVRASSAVKGAGKASA